MKKLVITTIAILFATVIAGSSYAADDQTLDTTIDATVGSTFSLAFYNDANVLYSTTVPFSNVDPTNQYNYPDLRSGGDGKSDIGLLVKTNQGTTWCLKVGINPAASLLSHLGYNMGQPTNRNTGSPADGTLGHGSWFNIPVNTSPETMYTAGTNDETNTPLGTLATLSFKIDGSGLAPGDHDATVTYTLAETP